MRHIGITESFITIVIMLFNSFFALSNNIPLVNTISKSENIGVPHSTSEINAFLLDGAIKEPNTSFYYYYPTLCMKVTSPNNYKELLTGITTYKLDGSGSAYKQIFSYDDHNRPSQSIMYVLNNGSWDSKNEYGAYGETNYKWDSNNNCIYFSLLEQGIETYYTVNYDINNVESLHIKQSINGQSQYPENLIKYEYNEFGEVIKIHFYLITEDQNIYESCQSLKTFNENNDIESIYEYQFDINGNIVDGHGKTFLYNTNGAIEWDELTYDQESQSFLISARHWQKVNEDGIVTEYSDLFGVTSFWFPDYYRNVLTYDYMGRLLSNREMAGDEYLSNNTFYQYVSTENNGYKILVSPYENICDEDNSSWILEFTKDNLLMRNHKTTDIGLRKTDIKYNENNYITEISFETVGLDNIVSSSHIDRYDYDINNREIYRYSKSESLFEPTRVTESNYEYNNYDNFTETWTFNSQGNYCEYIHKVFNNSEDVCTGFTTFFRPTSNNNWVEIDNTQYKYDTSILQNQIYLWGDLHNNTSIMSFKYKILEENCASYKKVYDYQQLSAATPLINGSREEATTPHLNISGDLLIFNNAENQQKSIYNQTGTLLIQTTDNTCDVSTLCAGVYIVRINHTSIKFIKN